MNIYIPEHIPSENKGEEAILQGIYQGFKDRGEEVSISIFSHTPEIDRINYGKQFKIISGITFRPAPGKPLSSRILEAVTIWSKHFSFLLMWYLLGKKCLYFFRGGNWKAYIDADVILVGHDGVFSDINLLFALFARAIKKKTAIFGCGIKKFRFKITEKLASPLISKIHLIVLREKHGYEYLRSLGIAQNKIFLKPDPAFFLKQSDQTKLEEMLSKEGLKDIERPFIGAVAVKGSIIFNKCFEQVKNKNEKYNKHIELFARIIENVIEITSGQIFFIPHCIGPTAERDDRINARDIKRKVKEKYKKHVSLIENEYNAMVLKAFIKNMDFLISERTHALIGAASVGTPFLAITVKEDIRTHDIIGDTVGREDLIIDINDPNLDEIISKFKKKWESRNDIRNSLLKKADFINKECQNASSILANLLKSNAR